MLGQAAGRRHCSDVTCIFYLQSPRAQVEQSHCLRTTQSASFLGEAASGLQHQHDRNWPCIPSVALSDTSCSAQGLMARLAGSGRSFTAYIFRKGAAPARLAGAERRKAAAAQPLRQAAEAGGAAQVWATAPMPDVPAQRDTFRQRLLPSPAQLASGSSPDRAGPAVAAAAAVATCTAEGAVAGSTLVVSAAVAVSMAPASASPALHGGRRRTSQQRSAEAAAEGGSGGRGRAVRTSPGVVRQTRASTARLRLAQQSEPHMGCTGAHCPFAF